MVRSLCDLFAESCPALPAFAEACERAYDGPVPTVGYSCERASATSVRASMKFAKYCLIVWLSIASFSSSAFSSLSP